MSTKDFSEPSFDLDFHQLLVPRERKKGRKNVHNSSSAATTTTTTNTTSASSSDASSFFIPEPLSRSNSVYSFSRASLSSQLAGLSSMSLPQAESLAANITGLSSARKACRALQAAAEQIEAWNQKALRIVKDLDADDDVEWAAAAGRDSLEETEKTVNKFENLVNVYVLAIEELQARKDIGELRTEELSNVVEQMEGVLLSWDDVRNGLRTVHEQVEVAMEWEELWNSVLGEVGQELDSLSQLVFEMEEKRHMAYMTKTVEDSDEKIDINELESFVDPTKAQKQDKRNSRFSMTFDSSPLGSPVIENPADDSRLLGLFARMQPLRASLDFLPMRIQLFATRAERTFPQACKELLDKRERLEKNWEQLSEEAERLRRELSEDRWIVVFRNAGRQAQKMAESVERSIVKVQEAVEAGCARTNPAALAKRVESFEAKKMHYLPAIQRVWAIVQKGLKDRLTVNGEILRLNKDLSTRVHDLEDKISSLDLTLEPITAKSNSKLRESISSIVSADRSLSSGTLAGTPGSSPASSIDLPSQSSTKVAPRHGLNGHPVTRAVSTTRGPPLSKNNKRASLTPFARPTTPSGGPASFARRSMSPAPNSVYRQGDYKPVVVPLPPRRADTPSERPRWSSTVRSSATDVQSKRASITPSSYYRIGPRSFSTSTVPLRSPLSQQTSSSPIPAPQIVNDRASTSQLRSFADRIKSPTLTGASGLMAPVPYSKARNDSSASQGTIRSPSSLANRAAVASNRNIGPQPSGTPATLRSSRMSSALPQRVGSPASPSQSANGLGVVMRTPSRFSDDNDLVDLDGQDFEDSFVAESTEIQDAHDTTTPEEDRATDLGSSPLSRRMIPRPPSSVGSRGGKRTSMLPVPVAGRSSSLGFR